MKVPVGKIIVGERWRQDLGDLSGLRDSILEVGQIQPIIVDKGYNLVAGARRLQACKDAGLTEVLIAFSEETDPLMLKKIELHENLNRKDFTWLEEVQTKKKLHLLETVSALDRGERWNLGDTALLLNEASGVVSEDIQLADALKDYPELAFEANKSNAFKMLKKLKAGELEAELKRRLGLDAPTFLLGDCLELLPRIPSDSIDFILTDPQWGIDLDKAYFIGDKVEFDDSEKSMKDTLQRAYAEFFRVLKPSGHFILFFGSQYYAWHISQLSRSGLEVAVIPGIWNKVNRGAAESPYQESNAYEPYLHGWKGSPRKLNRVGYPNVHTFPRPKPDFRIHSAEKPIDLLAELISLFTDPGETVLDPFAGSAATLLAAHQTTRKAIGMELSPEIYDKAKDRLERLVGENAVD